MREQYTKGKDASVDNLDFGEISKLIGEAWRNLPDEEKERLKQQSQQRRDQYKVEKLHFEQEKQRIQRAIEREQSPTLSSTGPKIEREVLAFPLLCLGNPFRDMPRPSSCRLSYSNVFM